LIIIKASTCGSSAGAKPKKEEIYLFSLRGSVWDVKIRETLGRYLAGKL